jgi:hypothetical protein
LLRCPGSLPSHLVVEARRPPGLEKQKEVEPEPELAVEGEGEVVASQQREMEEFEPQLEA